jgi:multiple RNA-binding domain-containing protein 1
MNTEKEKIEQERLEKMKQTQQSARNDGLIDSLNADKHDPKLKEFLEVMRPRGAARARTWANDDDLGIEATAAATKSGGTSRAVNGGTGAANAGDEDDAEYQDLPTVSTDDAETAAKEKKPKKEAKVDAVVHDSTMSDLDYFKARMRADLADDGVDQEDDDSEGDGEDDIEEGADDEEPDEKKGTLKGSVKVKKFGLNDEEEEIEDEEEEDGESAKKTSGPLKGKAKVAQEIMDLFAEPGSNGDHDGMDMDQGGDANKAKAEQEVPPAELIADTGRLFVRNLPYTCTPEELKALFEQFGPVAEVYLLFPFHFVRLLLRLTLTHTSNLCRSTCPSKKSPKNPPVTPSSRL